jgi:hypothetical protein
MPVNIKNTKTNITKSYKSERLQIDLASAKEVVEDMQILVYFDVYTFLGDVEVAPKYWDSQNPLILNCKGNSELTEAMKVIQKHIGLERYKQLTKED